jgi:2-polyprenyl-3-methyl-5-hydroxy-6-metoxy-1,4-benzoquinol methylase
MISTIPTILEQQQFYDDWNFKARSGDFNSISPEIRIRGEKVVEIIKGIKIRSLKILEVGCGTGWLTELLCDFGTVKGIDLSPQAIAIAKQREISVEFIPANFFDYEFKESFDLIVCMETLFYVGDQKQFVKKLYSLLNNDGYLVMTTVNKFVYQRSRDIEPPHPGQIRNWMTKNEIKEILKPLFKILNMNTIEPRGDMGILRLVNSPKINGIINKVISESRIKHIKEKLGLGGGLVILAKKF